MYKITGQIKKIMQTNQISEKFAKRELVITDSTSKYPQDIILQFVQDKCDLLESYSVGESVEVSFNLRGREWISPKDNSVKYFNTLDAWKISKLGESTISNDDLNDLKQELNKQDTKTDLPF